MSRRAESAFTLAATSASVSSVLTPKMIPRTSRVLEADLAAAGTLHTPWLSVTDEFAVPVGGVEQRRLLSR